MTATEVLVIIASLIALEGLLSADNAMVLAVMVKPLPAQLRRKALLYGIIGAYVLRGLMLAFASVAIGLWWVQLGGGAYLVVLAVRHLLHVSREKKAQGEGPAADPEEKGLGPRGFWRTVATVELVDLAFAVDSALVAVALTRVLWVIYVGVFIGILLLRLAASWFVGLLERYPRFELVAYALVGWAGIKLVLEGWSSLMEKALDQPDLALHLPRWSFWLVTLVLLGVGSAWALRRRENRQG